MSQPILSILICTLPERRESFTRLLHELLNQDIFLSSKGVIGNYAVEVLSDNAKRGAKTIGAKSNAMKTKARGKYVMRIDDDDMVTPHFLSLITEACRTGSDIITFDFNYFVDGRYLKTMIVNRFLPDGNNHCSKHWAINYNPSHRFTISDSHYHLMAVKKELVDKVDFIDANNMEDVEYSKALIPLIKTEFHIDHALLNVFYDTKKEQNV
jgi:hypothetical protein